MIHEKIKFFQNCNFTIQILSQNFRGPNLMYSVLIFEFFGVCHTWYNCERLQEMNFVDVVSRIQKLEF